MNHNTCIVISLFEMIGSSSAFGNEEGRAVLLKLSKRLDDYPNKDIFGISLEGVTRTDASFPRESVVALAKNKRGEAGFYLEGFSSKDLMDNWDYAAKAKDQPITVLTPDGYEMIGPELPAGTKELLHFIMQRGEVKTSVVADAFGVSAQNASGKLKKLSERGLILGTKEVAESGGLEFIYRSIIKI